MNEFYVGYLLKAPQGIRRRVRLAVVTIFVLAAAGALLFAAAQRNFAESAFDYGKTQKFSGRVVMEPYPALQSQGGDETGAEHRTYLLVAPGKHSADPLLRNYAGQTVRLTGTLIHRAQGEMIEIVPGSIALATAESSAGAEVRELGERRLTGEIVDTKCYLGVMNPGEGKVHRDCAARCLSGGIPPALATSDVDGTGKIVLLSGEDGRALPRETFVQRVGQLVEIRGGLFEAQNLFYIRTNAASIRVLR